MEKKMTKGMYDALVTLYQSVNISHEMLKNKLTTTDMSNTNTKASYLIKINELRDQLVSIKMKVGDEELVPIALNGFSSS
jgi:hypothetical protein